MATTTQTHWLVLSCGCPQRDATQKRGAVVGRLLESGCPLCGVKKRIVRVPVLAPGRG